MTFISQKFDQFDYFAKQIGRHDWRGLDVLDFGGNVGNILCDPLSTIEEERYVCIDVDPEAVAEGSRRYPRGRWIVYDRFCFYFNPRGTPGLPLPDLGQRFDVVCAYSVFPNTGRAEMLDLVRQLRALLRPDGVLAFTFIDAHHHSWPGEYPGNNLRWRLERSRATGHHVDVERILREAAGAEFCTVVNHGDLYVGHEEIPACPPEEQLAYSVYYTPAYIQSLYPDAILRQPVTGTMQHCCLLGPG